jgi:hypothetical protein
LGILTREVIGRMLTQQDVVETVEHALAGVPAAWAPEGRLQALEQAVRGMDKNTRLADTDGDGLADLLVTSHREPMEHLTPPVALFRGADLAAGRVKPYWLGTAPGAYFRELDATADVNGDGRREAVISYQFNGSGYIRQWFIYQWTGQEYRLLFAPVIDNWRGTNYIWIRPGKITVTCRPLGFFEQKHDPNRQHEETWVWNGQQYVFAEHKTPPATTAVWQMNDAERRFLRQEYAAALPGYRRALSLPMPVGKDLRSFIHLRLGESLALLGRSDEARVELQQAAAFDTDAGRAAATLLGKQPLPEALNEVRQRSPEGSVLAPAPVVFQAFLAAGRPGDFPSTERARADLDGDGVFEEWVHDLLGVKTPQGWRVGEVSTEGARLIGPRKRQLVFTSGALEWDGQHVRWRNISRPLLPPVAERCLDAASLPK